MSIDDRVAAKDGEAARPRATRQELFRTIFLSSTLSSVITVVLIAFLLRNTALINIYLANKSASSSDESDGREDNMVRRSHTTNARLTILHHAVAEGAVCLDGSPPGYYFRQGHDRGANNWIVHFSGGAWCFDEEACFQRSKTSLGSSRHLPPHPPALQGILSDDAKVNADFYNWNLVLLCYCDGASFTGYRREPVFVRGEYIYMRGKRILEVILEELLAGDMQRAQRVLLTGTSAGSLAVIMHADFIRSRIPKSIDVRALSDSGYFVDIAAVSGDHLIGRHFRKMFYVHNSFMGVDEDCVRFLSPSLSWKCIFPQHAVPFVTTPVFILQSAYDQWQLIHIRGINCQPPEYRYSYAVKRTASLRTARHATPNASRTSISRNPMSSELPVQFQKTSSHTSLPSRTHVTSPVTLRNPMLRDTKSLPLQQTLSPDFAWKHKHILGIFCKPPECTRDEMQAVLQYRNVTLYALRNAFRSKSNGLFLSSCFEHSQSMYDDTWNRVLIRGVSPAQAVADWCFARKALHVHIDCAFPCNPSCSDVW